MMAIEGPFLAAVIARLPDPKYNLAAYGVAFAFAILVEAPIIMIMSASTALVEDAHSFRKLRNFTYTLNAVITGVMLIVLIPPVFEFIAQDLIGLPDEVERLAHGSLLILLPWPAAIGFRRFFQGLLIRDSRTRLVAYGTVVRLTTMASTGLVLYAVFELEGALVGATALSLAVCLETIATRLMARDTVRRLLETDAPNDAGSDGEALDYRRIVQFYYPLALTSTLALAVHPMVTFFMGRARFPVESLAVLPVVNSLAFIFRSMGLSYQEVAIALMGKNFEHVKELGRFALGLGLASSLGLALIGFTPLSSLWFETVSGLSRELAAFAIAPTRILALIPMMAVLLSFQRAIQMGSRFTRPITTATLVEVGMIVLVLLALIDGLDMVGATAAAVALTAGRLSANLYLVPPCRKVLAAIEPH
jgi:hypothetical protein